MKRDLWLALETETRPPAGLFEQNLAPEIPNL
jgi:hypothetical protein